jgi:hypothetical protein
MDSINLQECSVAGPKKIMKTRFDSMFSLKPTHSIEEVLWNHGMDWGLVVNKF